MQQRGINKHQRNAKHWLTDGPGEEVWQVPSETPGQRNEAFERIRAQSRHPSGHNDKTSAENILLPFDVWIPFAAPERKPSPILKDTNGREQLKRRRQQNRQRIKELHRIHKRYESGPHNKKTDLNPEAGRR